MTSTDPSVKVSHTGTVLVLRTDHFDPLQERFMSNILACTDFATCVAADESKSTLQSSFSRKISVSNKSFECLGLYAPRDSLWRCGDYCLYAVRHQFPEASHFWVLEPDVYINTDSLSDFFSRLNGHEGIDFLASRYGPTTPAWIWYQAMSPFESRVFQCVFSFVRVSGRALDYLLQRRRAISARFMELPDVSRRLWPNDEVFCATELSNGSFKCKDLNEVGRPVYTRETLKITPPMSLKRLQDAEADELVYHPVLSGQAFRKKLEIRFSAELRKGLSGEQLARIFNHRAIEDLRIECGHEAAERFSKELRLACEHADSPKTSAV